MGFDLSNQDQYNGGVIFSDKELPFIIDAILKYCPDYNEFSAAWIWSQNKERLDNELGFKEYPSFRQLQNAMKNRELTTLTTNDGAVREFKSKLTDHGRVVKRAGGLTAYEQQQAQDKADQKERQRLIDEKLKADVILAKRAVKTSKISFIVSVFAVIIALLSLLVNILKHR